MSWIEFGAPRLADWCAVDLVEGDSMTGVAVAHVDPAKVENAGRETAPTVRT